MKIFLTFASTVITCIFALAESQKFSQDRAAILAMSGAFEVEFNFEEIVSLDKGYELKKPYFADAYELVKVAEDTGRSISLQHLLVVEGKNGPVVIKHWGQIWKYEDHRTLNYEGGNTWLPVTHTNAEVEGTWTQFVTQVDESPRYKAFGVWVHAANTSIWTSRLSTRPLPRREYTKRNDYDLLMATNRHVITPEGWVHQQENRKLVSREGKRKFLCMETGLNHYRRVSDETSKEGFKLAEAKWNQTLAFWGQVRSCWNKVIADADKPIRYALMVDGNRLMSEINVLARKAEKGEAIERVAIREVLTKFLR